MNPKGPNCSLTTSLTKATLFLLAGFASVALADEPTWTLSSGNVLRLNKAAETQKLVDSSGAVVAQLAAGEDVHGVIVSEGHTCLLALVFVERLAERNPNERGFNYAYLLRVTSDSGGWHTTRLLAHTAPPLNELHRFISELGAVSDDGRTALLKFGAANREQAPYTMDYVWQTWELDPPKLLGTGLKLEHAKR